MHGYRPTLATLTLVAASAGTGAARPVQIEIPGANPPAIVDRLDSAEGLTALAVGPELEMLAAAYLEQEKPERSSLRLYVGDEQPRVVEVAGRIRDLLFAADRQRIYGLLHRGARKGEGETRLVVYEVGRDKLRRAVRVPSAAHALDHWSARGSLLIASENEIRSLVLPDLRSGPLFRVLGVNLSLTTLGGGDLVLVGQEDAVVLVGLDDPPGQYEMPIRARADAPDRVVALASAPDGSEIVARLADGRLYGVTLDPLRLSERNSMALVASVEGHDPPAAVDPVPVSPPPVTVQRTEEASREPTTAGMQEQTPDEQPEQTAAAPRDQSRDEPTERVAPDEQVVDAPPEQHAPAQQGRAAKAQQPDTAGEPGRAATTEPVDRAAAAPQNQNDAAPEAPPLPNAQVSGRVVGAAAGSVVAVVLLGPDNLAREAARIVPAVDGRWSTDGLLPGRYRIQLDGGGSRVLVTEPPFLLLEVAEDRNVVAPDFRVRRAL